jgi:hypothetical protein
MLHFSPVLPTWFIRCAAEKLQEAVQKLPILPSCQGVVQGKGVFGSLIGHGPIRWSREGEGFQELEEEEEEEEEEENLR